MVTGQPFPKPRREMEWREHDVRVAQLPGPRRQHSSAFLHLCPGIFPGIRGS